MIAKLKRLFVFFKIEIKMTFAAVWFEMNVLIQHIMGQ